METFRCHVCGLNEKFDYKGTFPPFVKNIKFTEEVYIMKDPFSPSPTGYESKKSLSECFLILGSDCCVCTKPVCKDCGYFYAKSFCLNCAAAHITEFPLEIQSKIRKQINKN